MRVHDVLGCVLGSAIPVIMNALLLALALLVPLIAAQTLPVQPLPSPYPGRSQGNINGKIRLEAFWDFQCPDSEEAFGVLQDVLKQSQFQDEVYFILHAYSLPYHRKYAARATG